MEGAYSNPHALKPGEVLTPQLLFDRYLDWYLYKDNVKANSPKVECKRSNLHLGNLCCVDHFNLSHEWDDFVRYFCHLDMLSYTDPYFSNEKVRIMIIKFDLVYDLNKVSKYIHKTPEECREFLSQ